MTLYLIGRLLPFIYSFFRSPQISNTCNIIKGKGGEGNIFPTN